MKLSDRKLNILKAIVIEYIENAEAVGSRTLSKKYDFKVGAATIRNEMADLEDMGYLVQPHTSSGRVPTKKGYSLYVNNLMDRINLNESEKEIIGTCISNNVDRIDDLMNEISKMLSKLTNYTTIAMVDTEKKFNVIKHIQLVNLSKTKILLVIVSVEGDIISKEFETKVELEQPKLNIISDSLTKKLAGEKIDDLNDEILSYIKYEIGEYSNIVDNLIDVINNESKISDDVLLSCNGATNIFSYPEFNDIIKAKSFLTMLEEKERVATFIKNKEGIQKENMNIVIGDDTDGLSKDLSIVTATYNVNENMLGRISFIGPTRMDYEKIYSILNYMGLLMNKK